jgi:hypothetical protein
MADFYDAVAFPNLALRVIEMSKLDFQQKAKNGFRDERSLALKYYRGLAEDDYMSFITEDLRAQIPTPSNNITKRIIDRTSLVYMKPPIRSLGKEDDKKIAQYKKYTKGKDLKMQGAERKTNLLGMIAIKLTWRNSRIEYENIIDFEPFFGDDPMTPIAIAYPLSTKASVLDLTPVIWMYWDKDGWIKYEAGGKILEMSEPNKPGYGVLPFVFHFVDVPEGDFLDVSVDRELIFTNRVINVLQANANANVIFRSFGQKYATNIREDTVLTGGQDIILTLPEGSTLGSVAPEDTILSVKEAIKFIYQGCAVNHHLSAEFVEGTVLASGASLIERSRELTEDRKSDITRCRNVEEAIYVIEREILRVETGWQAPAAEFFSVDYEEEYIDESPEAKRARNDWELAHNWTTNAILLAESDPDKYPTPEDAQKAIDENRKANGLRGALSDALTQPVIPVIDEA